MKVENCTKLHVGTLAGSGVLAAITITCIALAALSLNKPNFLWSQQQAKNVLLLNTLILGSAVLMALFTAAHWDIYYNKNDVG